MNHGTTSKKPSQSRRRNFAFLLVLLGVVVLCLGLLKRSGLGSEAKPSLMPEQSASRTESQTSLDESTDQHSTRERDKLDDSQNRGEQGLKLALSIEPSAVEFLGEVEATLYRVALPALILQESIKLTAGKFVSGFSPVSELRVAPGSLLALEVSCAGAARQIAAIERLENGAFALVDVARLKETHNLIKQYHGLASTEYRLRQLERVHEPTVFGQSKLNSDQQEWTIHLAPLGSVSFHSVDASGEDLEVTEELQVITDQTDKESVEVSLSGQFKISPLASPTEFLLPCGFTYTAVHRSKLARTNAGLIGEADFQPNCGQITRVKIPNDIGNVMYVRARTPDGRWIAHLSNDPTLREVCNPALLPADTPPEPFRLATYREVSSFWLYAAAHVKPQEVTFQRNTTRTEPLIIVMEEFTGVTTLKLTGELWRRDKVTLTWVVAQNSEGFQGVSYSFDVPIPENTGTEYKVDIPWPGPAVLKSDGKGVKLLPKSTYVATSNSVVPLELCFASTVKVRMQLEDGSDFGMERNRCYLVAVPLDGQLDKPVNGPYRNVERDDQGEFNALLLVPGRYQIGTVLTRQAREVHTLVTVTEDDIDVVLLVDEQANSWETYTLQNMNASPLQGAVYLFSGQISLSTMSRLHNRFTYEEYRNDHQRHLDLLDEAFARGEVSEVKYNNERRDLEKARDSAVQTHRAGHVVESGLVGSCTNALTNELQVYTGASKSAFLFCHDTGVLEPVAIDHESRIITLARETKGALLTVQSAGEGDSSRVRVLLKRVMSEDDQKKYSTMDYLRPISENGQCVFHSLPAGDYVVRLLSVKVRVNKANTSDPDGTRNTQSYEYVIQSSKPEAIQLQAGDTKTVQIALSSEDDSTDSRGG